jgi:hypothetical protein
MNKDNTTKHDLQNTAQKTKDWTTRTPLHIVKNSDKHHQTNQNQSWSSHFYSGFYLYISLLIVELACFIYQYNIWIGGDHIMLYTSAWSRFELTTSVMIGTDYLGNYHTIMTTTALIIRTRNKDSRIKVRTQHFWTQLCANKHNE